MKIEGFLFDIFKGNITQLALKIKLETKTQKTKLNQQFGAARFVYNHFLYRRIKQYEDFKKSGL